MKNTILISAVTAAGILGYVFWPDVQRDQSTAGLTTAQGTAPVDIALPKTLSTNAQIGQRGFEANCAECHGLNGVGQQGIAPPLVHVIYEPGRHSDESFQRADVTMITQYVRELQRANGINGSCKSFLKRV